MMQYKKYKKKYNKIDVTKLAKPDELAQYRVDTKAAIAAVEALSIDSSIKYYDNEDGSVTRAVVSLKTGEVLEQKIFKIRVKRVLKSNNTTIATGLLFWELDAAKLNTEYTIKVKEKASAASSPLKRGAKPKIVPNTVKDGIENYSSVTEWIQAQPEVENILVGATNLNTKTVLTELDKPIAKGSIFSVLQHCDTINTVDTMELLEVGESQAKRINAVARIVNTQLSNSRVV